MSKKIGKVIEVFIPKEYKNGMLIDVMDSTKIGFKIMTEDEIIEVIEAQDEYNAYIMKDDIVVIKHKNISGKDVINLELYKGDEYA